MGNCRKRDDFSQLLHDLRVAKNVSPASLCKKICSESQFRKIENGERQATLMVKARLLKRLGEDSDKFDRFINIEEYRHWTARQKIIDAILKKDAKTADSLIEESLSLDSPADIVEKQFFMLAQAETAELSGTSGSELCRLYEEVRDLTVTVDEYGVPDTALLSPVELLLVLDCARFYPSEHKEKIFSYIREITQSHVRSAVELCLFAPKSLHMYITHTINEGNLDKDTILFLLKITDFAINKLISSGRLYYLKQLLLQTTVLYGLLEEPEYAAKAAEAEDFITLLTRLEEITETPLTPPPTSFFFSDRTVFSLASVIRRRRLMLGISSDELCKNICDRKTLCRVESMKTNIHEDIAEELLDRLKLQKDLQCHTMSTTGEVAPHIECEILQACSEKNYSKALEGFDKMETLYDKNSLSATQFFKRHRAILNYRAGNITTEEYAKELMDSLSLTLPIDKLALKDTFLTREEQSTIYNYLTVSDNPYIEAIFIIEKGHLEAQRKQIGLSFDAREYDAVLLTLLSSAVRTKDYKQACNISLDLLKNAMQNQRNQQVTNGLQSFKDNLKKIIDTDKSYGISVGELETLCEIAARHFVQTAF